MSKEKHEPIEIKTIGQLIDELSITNIKIFLLISKVKNGMATTEEAQNVQELNSKRNELVRAVNRRLGDQDIGGKLYNV